MKQKIIRKIIKWLISQLDEDYLIVRKERLNQIIAMANRLPSSKVTVLSLIRLDGCDLATALQIRNELNGVKE